MSDAMPPKEAGDRRAEPAHRRDLGGIYLDELVTVIPIAQTATSEGTAITLFSLEAFADGVRLRGRLVKNAPHSEAGSPTIPRMVLRLQDHCGNVNDFRDSHGHGNAVAARPLDPKAQQLTIELEEVAWRDVGKPPPDDIIERQRVNQTFVVTIPSRSE